MGVIPVFAGLGSEKLFVGSTSSQAIRDARRPHGQVLVETCHRLFTEEVSLAASNGSNTALGIDLADFQHFQDIIDPPKRYQHHPVVQHATLCLVQLLRYQSQRHPRSQSTVATSGYCAGLFPAIAAATASNALQFLLRAEECFRAAVMLGIAIQRARKKIRSLPSGHPWSLVLLNVEEDRISRLIEQYTSSQDSPIPIYISGKHARNCIIISSEGEALQRFAESALPSTTVVKPTNVYALYHDCSQLQLFRDQLLEEFEARRLSFPSRKDLLRPLISTADGSLIQCSEDESSRSDLLPDIFDMILLQKTDWVAVQETMATFANAESRKDSPLTVCNFGPGYGAHESSDEPGIDVQDLSQESATDECQDSDIAIVGFGVDLPDASDPEALWKNLMDGLSSSCEIPSDRFHVEDYLVSDEDEDNDKGRFMQTSFGNFMMDPFSFDNQLFGISPREAASIDPQQRVMLQTAFRALENAGYVPDSTPSFARETFGCYIGNSTLDYVDNLKDSIDVYYSPGTLRAFMSGRISYAFQWSGPSITLDTACSSSLVAIHQAVQALNAGDCRAAVAGGVNVITSPDMYLGLDKAHFLSPTGQCKAFDESADGYCRSEGCAAFVLKRLDDAVRENDRILGVIKGIAMNQSGQSTSITHPHPPTQTSLFRTLLEKSSMQADNVSVVEAHGTGTQAGDPNELNSIRSVFSGVHVGSIKSNIGHCEAASGGASLAKLLLMLRHKQIPPQALLNRLNPAIAELSDDGTIISARSHEWKSRPGKKRTALLNNFGAAGSNAALLLQEHNDLRNEKKSPASDALTYVLGCSARSIDLLEQMRKDLVAHFTAHKNVLSVADVCYTSTARRGLHTFRLSATASSIEELATELDGARIVEVQDQTRRTMFLFSGQGSQYLGMGKDLYNTFPKLRTTIDRCHNLLIEWGLPSCLGVILADEEATARPKDPRTLQAFQSGIYVLEVALAHFLIDLGIRPTAVAGHSLGEYAALVVAGVIDIESGLWLVAQRAKLIVSKCELWQTSMLAVDMNAEQVRKDLLSQRQFSQLSVSCENSPNDCVVGGSKDVLEKLKEYISDKLGKRGALLDVPVAYHTTALDPVLEELTKTASRVCLSPPSIAIASNVLGRLVEAGEEAFTPEYFAEHCRSPVAFDKSIESVLKHDDRYAAARWIEIGPHPALLPMVTPRAANNLSELLPTMKKKQHASRTLAELFAACYRDDLWQIDWRECFQMLPDDIGIVDLPPAPMKKQRYYVDLPRERSRQIPLSPPVQLKTTPYTLLQHELEPVDEAVATFQTPIQSLAPLITGHVVCGKALCPASVYAEMAFGAVSHFAGEGMSDQTIKLSKVEFSRPLLFSNGSSQVVRTNLTQDDSTADDLTFEVSSLDGNEPLTSGHCRGIAKWQPLSKAISKSKGSERALARRKAALLKGEHQTFTTHTMYRKIFSRVVEYSATYQAVQKIHLDEDAEEIFAICQLPPAGAHARYAGASPVLLDTMLHVAGFAANFNVDDQSVWICHHVRSVIVLRKEFEAGQAFEVHCSNFTDPSDPHTVMSDAHAVDTEGAVIAIIKGMVFQRMSLSRLQTAFAFASASSQTAETPRSSSRAETKVDERLEAGGTESPTVVDDEREGRVAKSAKTSAPPDAMDILSKTTGVKREDMTPQTDLRALGVDSMMIFELDKRLRQIEGQNHTVAQLTAAKTVGEFEELTSAAASRGRTPAPKAHSRTSRRDTPQRNSPNGQLNGLHTRKTPSVTGRLCNSPLKSPLARLMRDTQEEEPEVPEGMIELLRVRLGLDEQPERIQRQPESSNSPPLLLIHSGAGMCHFYRRIGWLDRAVNAIHDPCTFSDPGEDWSSLDDMAEHYFDIVCNDKSTSLDRGIILGGWSFGAVVAFELARLLIDRGCCSVRGVVLIDPPPPLNHCPMSRRTIEAATASHNSHASKSRDEDVAEFESAMKSLIIRNNMRRGALLGQFRPKRDGPMPRVVLLRSSKGLKVDVDPPPEGDMWLIDRSDAQKCVGAWEELTSAKVEVMDIPGDHFTPFEPGENIDGTTTAIRKACEMLD